MNMGKHITGRHFFGLFTIHHFASPHEAEPGEGGGEATPRPGGSYERLRNDLRGSPKTRAIIDAAHRTSLLRSLATALSEHALIVAAAAAGWHTLVAALACGGALVLGAAILVNVAVFLVIARSMRGLENLVHEASHYNFSRSKRLNDLVATLLVAMAVFQVLSKFRDLHFPHHVELGGPGDADRARNVRFGMDRLDRTSARAYAQVFAAQFWRYALAWFRDVGSSGRTAALSLMWHACALTALGASTGLGLAPLLACWAVYWCIPFFVFLPLLRFVAEAEEHVYDGGTTIAAATVSNLGRFQRWVLHPHGDGYHTLHHLRPAIPHHRLAAAHRALLAADPTGYGASLRVRTHVLQAPVPWASPTRGAARVDAPKSGIASDEHR